MSTIFIILVIVLILVGGIAYFVSQITSKIGYVKSTIQELQKAEELDPTPKSVSGATDLYLKQIKAAFPEFHETDAESAINVFMHEYLDIVYGKTSRFEQSNVDDRLLDYLKVNEHRASPYNISINRVAISGFKKSDAYATITYNVSVGYHVDGKRIETRYQINYTFKILDKYMMSEALTCANCGANLESTSTTVCPYCDAKIIRDTIMSWKFSSIKEI